MKNKHNNSDILTKCAACDKVFGQGDFLVLEDSEQKTTFHATCAQCQTATMIYLSAASGGVMSVGIATDLGREEIRGRFEQETVSADEVLAIHEFVSAYAGDIRGLAK